METIPRVNLKTRRTIVATEKKAKVEKPAKKATKVVAKKPVPKKEPVVKRAKSPKVRDIPEKSEKPVAERRREAKVKTLIEQLGDAAKKALEAVPSETKKQEASTPPWEDPYEHTLGKSTDPYAVGEKPEQVPPVDTRPRFAIEHEQIQKQKEERNARIFDKPVRDGGMSLSELMSESTQAKEVIPQQRDLPRVNGRVPLSEFFR